MTRTLRASPGDARPTIGFVDDYAALKPPLQRTLLLTKLDETVHYGEEIYELATNRWADGTIAPQGYQQPAAARKMAMCFSP